jgi:hypothetical protein
VLIESDEMFWMFMDEHNEIENYTGDAWPLREGALSHPRSNGTFAPTVAQQGRYRLEPGNRRKIVPKDSIPVGSEAQSVPAPRKPAG